MGFETLANIIQSNREQQSAKDADLANNECPDCAWPLKVNSAGEKACPICEKVFR
jgi:uncharacterized Zn finger protein (UPF0148 family)